jgi:poly-beta-1,6-N-acetyl-D-glucosamine N-deacetylase
VGDEVKAIARTGWHLTARFGLIVLALLYVAIPGRDLLQNRDAVSDQADPPARSIPGDVVRAARSMPEPAAGSAPLVLCYHEVEPDPSSKYGVTPDRLAEQLGALRSAGYRTISVKQFLGYLAGEPLPPRSLLITFDDGTKGNWVHADPILEQNGFTAVSFVITGSVGQKDGYYLSWDELQRMRESGRWELESHTYEGHVMVPSGPDGKTGPFLANRIWSGGGRESVDAFRSRITTDVDHSITDLKAHGAPAPRLFAFPYSATTAPTNDASLFAVASTELHRRFGAVFTDFEASGVTPPDELARHEVRRLVVTRGLTTLELLRRIGDGAGRAPGDVAHPFERPDEWTDATGEPRSLDLTGGALRIAPTGRTGNVVNFAPLRSASWTDYRADVTVSGLSRSAGTAGLRLLSGDDQQIQVGVSSGRVLVEQGRQNRVVLASTRVLPADHHLVSGTISNGVLVVQVDGQTVVSTPLRSVDGLAPRGGVGLFVVGAVAGGSSAQFSGLTVGAGTS